MIIKNIYNEIYIFFLEELHSHGFLKDILLLHYQVWSIIYNNIFLVFSFSLTKKSTSKLCKLIKIYINNKSTIALVKESNLAWEL